MEEFVKKIQVGEKFKVKFISMTHDGKGVCKINGMLKNESLAENFPIFVNNAISNEEGIIEITSLKKTLGNGKIIKLFKDKTSKYRVEPKCPIYENCGGCHLMHLSYEGQLAFKKSMVKQTMEKIGGFKDLKIKNVIGSVNQDKYRNKVQIPFGTKNNKTICGFYKNASHDIIPLESCYIQSDEMTEIVKFIRNLCNEFKIRGYNEEKHTGDIRHVLVRESKNTNQIMVVLVTLKKDIRNIDEFVKKLVNRHPKITSIMQNINSAQTNVILGEETINLYGKDYIEDILLGYKFKIGTTSFYQVNQQTTELLYSKAIEMAKFKPTDNIIDAYCGIGTIGICASSKVNHVYSVEIVKEAIKNAKDNAKANKVNNIEFVVGNASEQIVKWKKQGLQIDAIIVDPPRKGLDTIFMDTINEMDIKKILYISCDPATLARDMKYLTNLGYTPNYVQPVDMFPHTNHVENITVLTKN